MNKQNKKPKKNRCHLRVVPPRTEAERYAVAKYYFDAATMIMSPDPAIKAEGSRIIEELKARKQAPPPTLKVIKGGRYFE